MLYVLEVVATTIFLTVGVLHSAGVAFRNRLRSFHFASTQVHYWAIGNVVKQTNRREISVFVCYVCSWMCRVCRLNSCCWMSAMSYPCATEWVSGTVVFAIRDLATDGNEWLAYRLYSTDRQGTWIRLTTFDMHNFIQICYSSFRFETCRQTGE